MSTTKKIFYYAGSPRVKILEKVLGATFFTHTTVFKVLVSVLCTGPWGTVHAGQWHNSTNHQTQFIKQFIKQTSAASICIPCLMCLLNCVQVSVLPHPTTSVDWRSGVDIRCPRLVTASLCYSSGRCDVSWLFVSYCTELQLCLSPVEQHPQLSNSQRVTVLIYSITVTVICVQDETH